MKVLKKGRPQKGWAGEYICTGSGNNGGGCGAKLLVEEGDVFQTQSSCLGETNHYITFRCPECNVLTDITNPPSHLWDKAPKRERKPKEEKTEEKELDNKEEQE